MKFTALTASTGFILSCPGHNLSLLLFSHWVLVVVKVGAGILAIPAVTQESGFLASAVTCTGCWLYMVRPFLSCHNACLLYTLRAHSVSL